MNKTIKYYTKNVYGNELRYILDKEISYNIQHLTGQNTISLYHIGALENLGFTFEQVLEPKNS